MPKFEIKNIKFMAEKIKSETYLGLSSKTEEIEQILEFDLVTARQKGEEIRYLSISVKGNGQDASINVDEEAFNKIKTFFSQLEWNS